MLAERLTAQLLAGSPGRDPVAVAKRLAAIQAQDARGARLAIRARTTGLTAADVDRALSEDRSLLISWLNRGTLHLVRSEDYPWLHALTTPPLHTGNARRLAQEGVSAGAVDRAVETIEDSLAEEGALTRDRLRERIDRAGVRTEGQALVHLLMAACLRGIAVRGPMVGREHAYVLVRDWLGESDSVDRDRALAELARRYLAGHGPATDRDLAKWAGLPLRDARAGLAAISTELSQTPLRAGPKRAVILVDLTRRAPPAALPPPRMLGPYEPLLLGWASREPFVGTNERTIASNGLFRPFALVRGRAVAVWRMVQGEAVLGEPFERLTRDDAAALEEDAADVARFLRGGE